VVFVAVILILTSVWSHRQDARTWSSNLLDVQWPPFREQTCHRPSVGGAKQIGALDAKSVVGERVDITWSTEVNFAVQ